MKRIIPLFLVLFLLGFSSCLMGQTFSRSYGLPDFEEEGLGLLPLNSDTLVLAATKGDSTQLLFLDPDGNVLFNRSFKFARAGWKDIVTSIKLDSENQIYAVGLGMSTGNNDYEGFAFRYDYRNDQLRWNNTWTFSSDGFGIIEYIPGQYMIFGEDRGLTPAGENGLMARMNPATGTIFNAFQYNLNVSETFRSSVFLNGSFYTAGRFMLAQSADKMRASLAHIAPSGVLQQSRSFFADDTASARFYSTDLSIFDQQSLVMASYGNPEGAASTPRFVYLSRHDLTTDLIWGQEYNVTDSPGEIPVDVVREGNEILVLGRFETPAHPAFMMATDLNGNVRWCRSYPLYLQLPSGKSDGRMVVWNNSIYMTGAAQEGSETRFSNIGLVRANLDGSLHLECSTDTHTVAQVSNTISYPNGLSADPSTVTDISQNSPKFTPPLLATQLCPTGGASTCHAATDDLFTKITSSVTLTGYHTWDGKMYVDDAVIVTLQGANTVLDLTNVDIVFGECAGIDFVEGAELRANNSVFRPCDPDRSWRGFRFEEADSSFLNECTFKNAQRALHFEGVGDNPNPLSCRVSNNLFANNRVAIYSSFMAMSGAVSGNTFLVDGHPIDFNPASCPLNLPYANDHWGIRSMQTDWDALISQNDFINGRSADDQQDLMGVFAVSSSATFSNNQFSNAFRGIELSGCPEVSIENNRFEATQNFFDLENQIRATANCSWIWITGNQLVNSNESRNLMAGIFVDESFTVNIKENRIEGFAVGIQIRNLLTAQVGENTLWNNLLFGIHQENGIDVDVNCNQIHMHYRPGQNAIGMGYFHEEGDVWNNRFRSNCVWDSQVALLTSSTSGDLLPVITNNYFYNYEFAGIMNMGCTGNIGANIAPISAAGRNTFRSNNTAVTATAAAFDITSNVAIVANGNTGIANVNPNVFTNGNNLHGSTAACGNQAGNVDAEFLAADICDNFQEQLDSKAEAFEKSNFSGFDHLSDMDLYGLGMAWMQYFESNGQENIAAQINAHVSRKLSPVLARRLEVDHLWQRGEHELATQKLAMLTGNSRIVGLAQAEDHLMRGNDLNQIQIEDLVQWQNPQDTWGDHARDLLHLNAMRADYRFRDVVVPNFPLDDRRIHVDQAHFVIFPNPNSGAFDLEYAFGQGEGGLFKVFDPQGRTVFQTDLDHQAGIESFDLTELPMGIYFLRLRQGEKVLGSRKWIKLD